MRVAFQSGARTLRCRPNISTNRACLKCAAVKADVQKLLKLCEGTSRGVSTLPETNQAILAEVAALKQSAQGQVTTGPDLSASWRLVWTTEKETLFICEKAGLFGTKAGEVYQVIDMESLTLQNVITFPPDGAFIVNSGISVAGDQRVDFKFEAAALKVNGNKIPFPPFGKGWFDSVYMDDTVRVAEDIRGDTLIVVRDGPPKAFT